MYKISCNYINHQFIKLQNPFYFRILHLTTYAKTKQKGSAMQNTQLTQKEQELKIQNSLTLFFKKFGFNKILRQSNISKIRGIPVVQVLSNIFQLPFLQKNFYQGIVKNSETGYNKTVAYDFLSNSKHNWRKLIYFVVSKVINENIKPLTSEAREDVFIIDDSGYPRNRSKKVELLAKVFDHTMMRYFKGFRLMQLGWSDGNSLIPVDFSLLSSPESKNRYNEMNDQMDKHSCGYIRRKESVRKQTDLIEPMIKRAISWGIKAKYLLMDSWYGWPSLIIALQKYLDVICMVKNTPKVFYYKGDTALTVGKIYQGFRKKRGKANIKGSQIVEIEHDGERRKVKIVFVKNRSKKRSWLAILSTDINLSDEDIVRIYGKRWDIEVFFKTSKHCLNLCHEVELRSYDGMIAHISIVLLRYLFLSVEQRSSIDGKTFGGVFLEMVGELKDISIIDALVRIIGLAFNKIREIKDLSEKIIDELIEIFVGLALEKYGIKVGLA